MKYMTFNSSCSYAGLANLLEFYGFDTTDRTIALEMGLPYLLDYEDGTYLAGPMLQGKRWFDLYLLPHGFNLVEIQLPRKDTAKYLCAQNHAMLGMHVSRRDKHAVVYCGAQAGRLEFLNAKWENEPAPERFLLTEEELLDRLDDLVTIATLEPCIPRAVDLRPHKNVSLCLLVKLKQELHAFCSEPRTTAQLHDALNRLFRPVLLDGISMMNLLDETALVEKMQFLQRNLMQALRSGQEVLLSEVLPSKQQDNVIDLWCELIHNSMQ